jgi:hypothetical protein
VTHSAVAVASTWDGKPARADEVARVSILLDGRGLLLEIDAPFHNDPPPSGPPGPTDRLWEHEVVEVFVCGPEERYTEIEIGPHGHHLVLRLDGVRKPTATKLPLELSTELASGRWTATARLAPEHLPKGPHRFNAYAIHGVGDARRHLAWRPPGGDAPDFHRLNVFTALPKTP